VLFLFGMLAHKLGFAVTKISIRVSRLRGDSGNYTGRWQRLRIELEFESSRSWCTGTTRTIAT